MNEFKEKLKTEEKNVKNKIDNISFDKRVSLAIINAINSVETYSPDEDYKKIEYLLNISKILENYEQLRPTLTEYFKKQKFNEK